MTAIIGSLTKLIDTGAQVGAAKIIGTPSAGKATAVKKPVFTAAKSNTGLFLGLGAGALVLGGIVLFVLLREKKGQ